MSPLPTVTYSQQGLNASDRTPSMQQSPTSAPPITRTPISCRISATTAAPAKLPLRHTTQRPRLAASNYPSNRTGFPLCPTYALWLVCSVRLAIVLVMIPHHTSPHAAPVQQHSRSLRHAGAPAPTVHAALLKRLRRSDSYPARCGKEARTHIADGVHNGNALRRGGKEWCAIGGRVRGRASEMD